MAQVAERAIPAVVRRNTWLFVVGQAFAMIGSQMVPALSAIMVAQLFGLAALAGLPTSITGISRLVIAYPIGMLTDRYGRRGGLLAGIATGLFGAAAIGLAAVWSSFPLFLVGIFVFGIGSAAAFQIRLAAADMYPPSRRAEGLGYVLSGSLVGALGAPLLVSAAEWLAGRVALDSSALTWLLVPLTIVPALVAIALVRPDPKEISAHLGRYYPGYVSPPEEGEGADDFRVRGFLSHFPNRVAVASTVAVQGTMNMMMAMTGLVLAHQGHALHAVSLSVGIHVIGMFGLSLPLGRLTDAFGRRAVMLVGLGLSVAGAFLVPSSPDYWVITAGIFLVGVGWSCVNVAATALLVDTTRPAERGRAIGTLDTISSVAGIALPLVGGALAELFGLEVLGVMALALMVVPFVMLVRLNESRPGQYRESPAPA